MKNQNTEMPNKAEMPNSAGKAELPGRGGPLPWDGVQENAEHASAKDAIDRATQKGGAQ